LLVVQFIHAFSGVLSEAASLVGREERRMP
jgi:hypothetical protein